MRVFSLIFLPIVLSGGVTDHPEVLGQERLFESWIRGQMTSRHLPGIAVGVVFDQELIWAKGFGFADVDGRVPMVPATKFRMASHSKLFTSTAIMQLRDGAKLRLDDPVSKYLPWFKIKPAEPGDPEITIEELVRTGPRTISRPKRKWKVTSRSIRPCTRRKFAGNIPISPLESLA
jgi:hypothetical protein